MKLQTIFETNLVAFYIIMTVLNVVNFNAENVQ